MTGDVVPAPPDAAPFDPVERDDAPGRLMPAVAADGVPQPAAWGNPAAARDQAYEAATGSGRMELDTVSLRLALSPGAAALHGLPHAAALTLPALLARVHAEDRPEVAAAVARAIRGDTALRCDYRLADGTRWIEARGGLAGGTPPRLLMLALDITARRLAEERDRLALREVEHRAKNALATAQAVVRLTRAEDPRDFARAVERRLAVLGRAHARLSAASPGSGFPLSPLLEETFAPYDDGAVTLRGPDVTLPAPAVQPVSMALHELATNAAKYGALSRPEGRVALHWRLRGAGGLTLAWREAGGPEVRAPTRRGFGLTMVQAVIRDQLGGRLRIGWEGSGLRLAIGLPASSILLPRAQAGRIGGGTPGAGMTGTGSMPTAGRAKR